MLRFLPASIGKLRCGPWCWILLIGICLAPCGCTTFDLRGETFPHDDTFDVARRVRHDSRQSEFFGFSNKARRIEENLGAR